MAELLARRSRPTPRRRGTRRARSAPGVAEHRLEHLLLRGEVVVEQPVGDARLLGDVADAAVVVARAREDAHGGVEDQLAASPPGRLTGQSKLDDDSCTSEACNRSNGMLVADFTWYLPGPFASRELLPPGRPRRARRAARRATRCGPDRARLARRRQRRQGVGRLRPEGRRRARAGERALRPRRRRPRRLPPRRARAARRWSCPTPPCSARSPASAPATATSAAPATTSTTSAGRACSHDTAPAMPPTQIADLAAGGLSRRAGGRPPPCSRASAPAAAPGSSSR